MIRRIWNSIPGRFAIGFGMVLVLMMVFFLISFNQMMAVNAAAQKITPLGNQIYSLNNFAVQTMLLETSFDRYLVIGGVMDRDAMMEAMKNLERSLMQAQFEDPFKADMMSELGNLRDALEKIASISDDRLSRSRSINEGAITVYGHLNRIKSATRDLVRQTNENLNTMTLLQQSTINRVVSQFVVLTAALVLILLGSLWWISANFVRPLTLLSHAVAAFAGGDLTARADVFRQDEIGRLAQIFNHMTEQIQEQVTHLQQQAEDLAAAEEEQRNLNLELEERVARRTAQLQAANQDLEAFSYSVSHDLRAPLRSIGGFNRILLEDYSEKMDDRGQEYLHRVDKNVARMEQLIEGLLTLSRLTRAEMEMKKVNLSALVEECAAEAGSADPVRKVDWLIQPELNVNGDERLLRAAVQNLVDNAFKFTAKAAAARIEFGLLTVDEAEGRWKQGSPVYFIRDNGAGFDMAYAGRLFQVFQRMHTQDEFQGIGIGLATVKRIINRHGGKIWAEGQPGQGATFYFTLN
ncbi:MAG TPA: ATP-binding protein [Anaerolineaceae bacterium]|nr:ATP-binding protein [Anaerolineaceae bacterium]HPN50660.1 ATP-binding protein [Anaerolineaceae bacterium]